MLGVAHGSQARQYLWSRPQAMRTAVEHSRSPGFKRRWERRYARMQRVVPEGAVLLTRLQYPFLLDFASHTIFIADLPGGASPPPGMPSFQGGESLAAYLCGQGVRYVAYSYAQEAGFGRATFRSRLHPGTHPWPRAQARLAFDFQSSLDELGRTRHRIFDDGDVFVLDLGRTPAGVRVGCRAPIPASPSNGQRHAH
jgi:hypothetical protein